MDINQFLRQRKPRWNRLTIMLDRIDAKGLRDLSSIDVEEFFTLYRLVSSDLNLVQTRTANPALLEYLEGLVGRAYANLSVPRRLHPLRGLWKILRHRFPAVMRREKKLLTLAASTMLLGALFGFIMTFLTPRTAEVFLVPFPSHLTESPRARVNRLEALERHGKTRINSSGTHARFTTQLFTNNIRVTILGFALGLTFGIGTIIVLFYNGAILGSLAALYLQDGVIVFFLAWVGPHGSIELPCILFGCTAGLMLSRAQFRRDEGSLRQQFRQLRPDLVAIIIGTSVFLVLAGFIEGGFSQINEPTLPYPFKILVAVVLFLAFLAYLFWLPVCTQQSQKNNLYVNNQ